MIQNCSLNKIPSFILEDIRVQSREEELCSVAHNALQDIAIRVNVLAKDVQKELSILCNKNPSRYSMCRHLVYTTVGLFTNKYFGSMLIPHSYSKTQEL